MEQGKFYTFYTKLGTPMAGRFDKKLGNFYEFDCGGVPRLAKEVHDEINPDNTSSLFLFHLRSILEDKFGSKKINAIFHDDYEFTFSIARPYGDLMEYFGINKVEETMDRVLEDFWSVTFCELQNNKIEVKINEVVVTFKLHPIHEIEMRWNDERAKYN